MTNPRIEMIKYILVFILAILIGLMYYSYSKQADDIAHKVTASNKNSKNIDLLKDQVISHEKINANKEDSLSIASAKQDTKKMQLKTSSVLKPILSQETQRKIEAEVKGESKATLSEETLRKIEAEVKGESKATLSEETLRKIEAEVKDESKATLSEETLRKIEAEVKEATLSIER